MGLFRRLRKSALANVIAGLSLGFAIAIVHKRKKQRYWREVRREHERVELEEDAKRAEVEFRKMFQQQHKWDPKSGQTFDEWYFSQPAFSRLQWRPFFHEHPQGYAFPYEAMRPLERDHLYAARRKFWKAFTIDDEIKTLTMGFVAKQFLEWEKMYYEGKTMDIKGYEGEDPTPHLILSIMEEDTADRRAELRKVVRRGEAAIHDALDEQHWARLRELFIQQGGTPEAFDRAFHSALHRLSASLLSDLSNTELENKPGTEKFLWPEVKFDDKTKRWYRRYVRQQIKDEPPQTKKQQVMDMFYSILPAFEWETTTDWEDVTDTKADFTGLDEAQSAQYAQALKLGKDVRKAWAQSISEFKSAIRSAHERREDTERKLSHVRAKMLDDTTDPQEKERIRSLFGEEVLGVLGLSLGETEKELAEAYARTHTSYMEGPITPEELEAYAKKVGVPQEEVDAGAAALAIRGQKVLHELYGKEK